MNYRLAASILVPAIIVSGAVTMGILAAQDGIDKPHTQSGVQLIETASQYSAEGTFIPDPLKVVENNDGSAAYMNVRLAPTATSDGAYRNVLLNFIDSPLLEGTSEEREAWLKNNPELFASDEARADFQTAPVLLSPHRMNAEFRGEYEFAKDGDTRIGMNHFTFEKKRSGNDRTQGEETLTADGIITYRMVVTEAMIASGNIKYAAGADPQLGDIVNVTFNMRFEFTGVKVDDVFKLRAASATSSPLDPFEARKKFSEIYLKMYSETAPETHTIEQEEGITTEEAEIAAEEQPQEPQTETETAVTPETEEKPETGNLNSFENVSDLLTAGSDK